MSDDTATKEDPKNLPNYRRPEACAVDPDLDLVHDLIGGTRVMWAKAATGSGGTPYIFKWSKEDGRVYAIRSTCETVFQGLERTLNAATGMLFAKPPAITWNASETAMAEHWANLDGAGTAGPVLIKRFSESSLRDGLGAILVDHPSPPTDPETEEPITIHGGNEKPLGLRPTWALYARRSIINWRTAIVNNQKALTMVVFAECAEVDDGDFGVATRERYRVLRLVLTPDGYQATWTLYELRGDGDKREDFQIVASGAFKNKIGVIADFLPVSIAYTGRTDAPLTATIPLLGVAWANLGHWQQSTDLRFYRMVAAFPQPKVKGELVADPVTGEKALNLGPLVGVQVEKDGDYTWTELSGTSMVQLENGIKEKLAQMGQLGLSFLVSDTRAAETADAKRLDATAQNSTLATAAQGIEDCVNGAFEHHAWYLGIAKAQAPVCTISRDYDSTAMDSATMTAYAALVAEGFPKRAVLEALQAGGRIPSDADLDALALEWDAGLQAQQDAKVQAAADALKLQQGKQAAGGAVAPGVAKPDPAIAA